MPTDFNAFADTTAPADGDHGILTRGGAGLNFNYRYTVRLDTNFNVSFAADPTGYVMPNKYGYWAGFPFSGGSDPGFSYEPIDTDVHRFSLLNNAFQTGNGTYTNQCAYRRSSTSATRYYSVTGRHVFEAADPGVAGNVVPWRSQLSLERDGTVIAYGPIVGGANSSITAGNVWAAPFYSGTQQPHVYGSMYSSGEMLIGFGLKCDPNASQFKSSVDVAPWGSGWQCHRRC
jgi:hypothetical protein